jgi:hypothetical protein
MPRSARQLLARTPGALVTYPAALGGWSSGRLAAESPRFKSSVKRINRGKRWTSADSSAASLDSDGVSIRSRIDGAHEGLHLIDGRWIL